MPRPDAPSSAPAVTERLIYSPVARLLHWSVAALVLITAPVGFIMVDRSDTKIPDGPAKEAFEATTELMYSWHKVIGLVILALMLARLLYRLTQGAPRSEPSLSAVENGLSHALHWTLYALLIAIPISGYIGISYGDYLSVFGAKLPGLVALHDGDNHDKVAEQIFKMHGWAATVLLTLAALHILAALYHRFVKRDAVLARMMPGTAGSDTA